jgi:hypothetical protein
MSERAPATERWEAWLADQAVRDEVPASEVDAYVDALRRTSLAQMKLFQLCAHDAGVAVEAAYRNAAARFGRPR